MTYLVDTDVLIDYLRNMEGAADYLDSIGEWTYSVVTAMELITGAANQKDVKKLEKILNDYREMPLSQEIGSRARELMKTHAKSAGLLPLDALIAATALHERVRLSTKNKKHFRNIEGLDVEVPEY
jgi:predicted nucleic acid-binding protein